MKTSGDTFVRFLFAFALCKLFSFFIRLYIFEFGNIRALVYSLWSVKLSGKHRTFCAEYMLDENATQAAIRAGYSPNGASVQASRLLGNANIFAEIERLRKLKLERAGVRADRVLNELALLGFSNMRNYVDPSGGFRDIHEMTEEQTAAIQELTYDTYEERDGEDRIPVKRVKFKLAEKRGALELLGKHLRLFADKVEIINDDSLANIVSEFQRVYQVVSSDSYGK